MDLPDQDHRIQTFNQTLLSPCSDLVKVGVPKPLHSNSREWCEVIPSGRIVVNRTLICYRLSIFTVSKDKIVVDHLKSFPLQSSSIGYDEEWTSKTGLPPVYKDLELPRKSKSLSK